MRFNAKTLVSGLLLMLSIHACYSPGTRFDAINIMHEQVEEQMKGLTVHTDLTVLGLEGRKLRLDACFYDIADSGRNKDLGGTSVFLSPVSDEDSFRDVTLFLPYSNLMHSLGSNGYRCKLILTDMDSGEDIAESDYQDFTVFYFKHFCPVCGGTGIIEYMPGDLLAPRYPCRTCDGSKFVEVGYGNLDGAFPVPAINPQSIPQKTRPRYVIEQDLREARERLADMYIDRENCTSVVLKPTYNSLIRNQEEYINRLEAELSASRR